MLTFEREELIPEPLRLMIESFIGTARGIARKGDDLAPIAWVGNVARGEAIAIPLAAAQDKNAAARMMARTAQAVGADFIFQLQESWMYSAKSKEEADALKAKYKSVRDYPGAFDAVWMNLETSVSNWACAPRISKRPGSSKQRVFDEDLIFRCDGHLQGRFVGLLQPIGTAQ
jgi:hypothetical protein